MEKVLIVEDDRDLSRIMQGYLSREGYEAHTSGDGETALKELEKGGFSAVLLDIMLPEIDGIDLVKLIRRFSSVPVIVTSARSGESDKLLLLELGADDYMTKPFSMREMVARVGAQVRRSKGNLGGGVECRQYGRLKIYPKAYRAEADGEAVPLSPKEFRLLDYLSKNRGQVFSKQQLMDEVWGYDIYIDENTVVVSVARLREKLLQRGVDSIKTVWGVGYKWQE